MTILKKFGQLYHTVKPLRWEQVVYRIKARYFPLKTLPDIELAYAADWCWHGPEVLKPSILSVDRVCYLNQEAKISVATDWNNPAFEKLWLYNLHYFDDLNAADSLSRKSIQLQWVTRWISENPPVIGNGWEPYPLSLRLVNWIKWYRRSGIEQPEIILSIQQQAEALSRQLEYHILGNHLFANAKALIFCGVFLQGADAERYLSIGLKILQRELSEQFLDDGGHFELSPMYHAILLWDLLDLINLAGSSRSMLLLQFEDRIRSVAQRGISWLHTMLHPDQEVSFFNDSTTGIAAKPCDLFSYASMLGLNSEKPTFLPLKTLAQSGYSRVSQPEHILLFDHGAVGPEYLPGHAHADTLSIEWSVGLQRVIVNSGTSVYGISDERLRQRKTAAHNTVQIDGADSSEVWSGFRVARRAYGKLLQAKTFEQKVALVANHNGYQRLSGKVTHQRELEIDPSSVILNDRIKGNYETAEAFFHFHPSINIELESGRSALLKLPDGKEISLETNGELQLFDSTWHPAFGVSVSNKKICVRFLSSTVRTRFRLQGC